MAVYQPNRSKATFLTDFLRYYTKIFFLPFASQRRVTSLYDLEDATQALNRCVLKSKTFPVISNKSPYGKFDSLIIDVALHPKRRVIVSTQVTPVITSCYKCYIWKYSSKFYPLFTTYSMVVLWEKGIKLYPVLYASVWIGKSKRVTHGIFRRSPKCRHLSQCPHPKFADLLHVSHCVSSLSSSYQGLFRGGTVLSTPPLLERAAVVSEHRYGRSSRMEVTLLIVVE